MRRGVPRNWGEELHGSVFVALLVLANLDAVCDDFALDATSVHAGLVQFSPLGVPDPFSGSCIFMVLVVPVAFRGLCGLGGSCGTSKIHFEEFYELVEDRFVVFRSKHFSRVRVRSDFGTSPFGCITLLRYLVLNIGCIYLVICVYI